MKQTFLFFLLAASLLTKGQVLININLPPAGISLKSQLWNLSLVSTFPETQLARLEMRMNEIGSGQTVLSGISKFFPLSPGVKIVQAADVMPVTYQAESVNFPVDANPDGFLPVGVFSICYTLIMKDGEVVENIGEECETIAIEPISPPQLVIPGDSECVELSRPVFTWLPPAPYNLFNNLVYDWKLVEIQGLQTAADALQINIPILVQRNLTGTTFQYPLSARTLDTSRLYAWAVTAKSGINPIANSEVWTFKMNCMENIPKPVKYVSYLKVKPEEDAETGIFSGTVSFEYINEINDPLIKLYVWDITQAARRQVAGVPAKLELHFGQNLLQLDFTKNSGMVDGHVYLLELVNSKNERKYLKFEFRKFR